MWTRYVMATKVAVRAAIVWGAASALVVACGGNPDVGGGADDTGGRGGTAPVDMPKGGSSPGPDIIVPGEGGVGGEATMTPAVCGNGMLERGELCDDGDTLPDDGCSEDCLTQDPDFDCSAVGEPCKDLVVCGNSVLEGDEACDDGNELMDDGCSEDCSAVTSGFVCPRPGKPCVELPVCGNGKRERGEQCDLGPAKPDDGCSDTCQEEPNYECTATGCRAIKCGDGVRTSTEECDDAQDPPKDGDGCSKVCKLERGFRCSASGCAPICGDGIVVTGEGCDDGDRAGGDGCSAACKVEPFHSCGGMPSKCVSTIACGNGDVEPGEICDPPGKDGCNAGCKSFSPDVGAGSKCGNSVIEAGEQCDPPMAGKGCNVGCALEDGFTCPRPGVCFKVPSCGDGVLHALLGEECDDGNGVATDGCDQCKVVPPYSCFGLQPSVCIQEICGDGIRTPSEACDDGANGAGCTNCMLDSGWACPVPGQKCLERCGDGIKVGSEQCDDHNLANGDGCNAGCRIEPDFACPTVNAACVPAVCGDGKKEGSEACDDSNAIAGDGCGPTCQAEPVVTPGTYPSVAVSCGDGLITSGEVCDDGNTVSGDGCKADCSATEPEFTCSNSVKFPGSVEIKVTYRDFKQRGSSGGHPDFEWNVAAARGIPGPVCTAATTECLAAAGSTCPVGTCGYLDAQGKPAFHLAAGASAVTNASTYSLWYRDTNPTNIAGQNGSIQISPLASSLVLTQQGGPLSDVYAYDSTSFWPLTGLGFGNDGNSKNFHFTTELRYFFQYKGGETLTFRGDDDVWVFVNGRHAVDIGGVHGAEWGRVILGDDGGPGATDSNCSVHRGGNPPACALEANEVTSNDDTRFGLTKGQVYEIVLFQAERHTTQSNFRLTLAGFLAPRTFCDPKCGDGVVVAGEVCDDGAANQDGVSGKCNKTCTARAVCGDGAVQSGETCDNGTNQDLYWDGVAAGKCAPGCKAPPKCGDGSVQPAFEDCDQGAANSNTSYGSASCTLACQLGPYCGDGTKNGPESCDLGASNGGYGVGSCGYDCKPGPFCGDKVRNGTEECDGSANCNASCKLDPFCGDGVVSAGEECDNGQFASSDYGGCTAACKWAGLCGDASVDKPFEECDLGAQLNDGTYGGCTPACTLGPRCGDALVQADKQEACDNGFNDDVYATTANACGPGCTTPPSCGDGKLQPDRELCDLGADNKSGDAAYNGCTTQCEWGPFCGDGVRTRAAGEACDLGANNKPYSSTGEGCGYDCQPAPYCGDGQRNGPEQCDAGKANNTGAYGGCNADCTVAPFCGDKKVQVGEGEQCDDGPTGSLRCTPLCKRRAVN